jgi:hypothetical protein
VKSHNRSDYFLTYRIRYAQDDAHERQNFIESLNMDWEMVHIYTGPSNLEVDDAEKSALAENLRAATQRNIDSERFFKVILLLVRYVLLIFIRSILNEFLTWLKNEKFSFDREKLFFQSRNNKV